MNISPIFLLQHIRQNKHSEQKQHYFDAQFLTSIGMRLTQVNQIINQIADKFVVIGCGQLPRFVERQALLIAFIPFVLILKQPDLGTALVLFPIALVMF